MNDVAVELEVPREGFRRVLKILSKTGDRRSGDKAVMCLAMARTCTLKWKKGASQCQQHIHDFQATVTAIPWDESPQ
jgi:hypothetical protein